MKDIREGKLLYHLTRLSNLDSIIEQGLISRGVLENNKVKFTDIADPEIMHKRKASDLEQYIPFHFHPYSSFDVAVKNKYNDEIFIYICITRSYAKDKNFKILPKHPLSSEEIKLYDYNKGIELIDWDAMNSSSTESEYAKNVRMAECLSMNNIDVCHFQSIAVKILI